MIRAMGYLKASVKSALDLLREEKYDELERFIRTRMTELSEERDGLLKVLTLVPPRNHPVIAPRQPSHSQRIPPAHHAKPLTKAERKVAIRETADALGKKKGWKLTAQEVVEDL